MKRNCVLPMFCVGVCFLINLVSCASTPPVTVTEENVAAGKLFRNVVTDHYNSLIPVEEHCYIIVLEYNLFLEKPGGRRALYGDISIIPPGNHKLKFYYMRIANNIATTAEGDGTYDLQAGHYYFMHAEHSGDKISFKLDDLNSYPELDIYPPYFSSNSSNNSPEKISVHSIIEGMNAKIISKFSGFKGGIVSTQLQVGDNVPPADNNSEINEF